MLKTICTFIPKNVDPIHFIGKPVNDDKGYRIGTITDYEEIDGMYKLYMTVKSSAIPDTPCEGSPSSVEMYDEYHYLESDNIPINVTDCISPNAIRNRLGVNDHVNIEAEEETKKRVMDQLSCDISKTNKSEKIHYYKSRI